MTTALCHIWKTLAHRTHAGLLVLRISPALLLTHFLKLVCKFSCLSGRWASHSQFSALWPAVNAYHICGLLKQKLLWWGSRATLVCRNNYRYWECSWKFYSFRKLAAVCFLLWSIVSTITVSWQSLYFQAQNLSYKCGLKSN